MFLEDLERAALEKSHLNKEKTLLVGVSGGADSLALMHGMHVLGFNLVIAHLDHALRPESPQEAEFVSALAASYNIPFVCKRIDVRVVAEEESQSLEEAARECRYRFLFEAARIHRAQAVAVAHHADDQVETVLMHLLRGAALPGLSGMSYRQVIQSWDETIPLVRPLLGLWREEINHYVADVGLKPCVDLSNQDTTYFRNRLRHELIPELETYNPQFKQILWRMADILQEEDRFLSDLADAAWKKCLLSKTNDHVELNHPTLLQLDKALQRRVLRQAISTLRPDLRDVGFDAVERGLKFIVESSEKGEIDLVSRLNLAVVEDIIIVKTWDAPLPDWKKALLPDASFSDSLEIGSSLSLRHGWQIEATLIKEIPDEVMDRVAGLGANEVWLDYDTLRMPLIVRSRKEGERWQPLGMREHTQKLSDFFINEKIPEHLRDIWPLICSGERIAWVVGLRPSELFKITKATRCVLRLKLIKD
jgi:tRNA(Ile)-lysidine synthase